jgi:hypothetical protein
VELDGRECTRIGCWDQAVRAEDLCPFHPYEQTLRDLGQELEESRRAGRGRREARELVKARRAELEDPR